MGEGDTRAHRLPPEVKIAACVAFIVIVVATPRTAMWAFGLHLGLVVAVAHGACLHPAHLVRGLRIELPFVAFAALLPVIGSSPRVDVVGLSLSQPGLWAAWTILAKASLGVMASTVLIGTTPVADLLRGLERLHLPRVITAIGGFMVRYLAVISGEASRMRIARLSRGDNPRWLWQAKGLATTAGTLFVRSYERGERVHLAMRSRGYAGTMPLLDDRTTTVADWLTASVLPVAAGVIMVMALLA